MERPRWLDESLYPFQSRYLEWPDCRVHYVDEGAGPALLFLHPAPAWSFFYRNFITGLQDRFRCIALDYPGFGFSTASPGYGYTLPEHSAIVERFITTLNLADLTMMVHDSGGPIGLRVAGLHPGRFQALILTDTFGWPLSGYPKVVRVAY
ncbi:MAG: alpha/beta fold hydrolase [Candidatus Binatia bacterium]